MSGEAVQVLSALAMTGIYTGVETLALLAKRGLVSPEEVEEFADNLTEHFSVLPTASAQKVREMLEATAAVQLADVRRVARENWPR